MRAFATALVVLLVSATSVSSTDLPDSVQDMDFRSYPAELVQLGQLLFYDRVLSGGRTVSCGTCHNHSNASSNGVSLDASKPKRDEMAVTDLAAWEQLNPSPAHAPPLFNLGAKEFTILFGDGRVAATETGFRVPDGVTLPNGLADILAVQALFPAITSKELAIDGEDAVHADLWRAMERRVADLKDYAKPFNSAFSERLFPANASITNIANAIGAFVGTEWRADDAPFDRYLRGDTHALTPQQKRGMTLFYGKGQCGVCHSGKFQTDHHFHIVATPSFRFDADFSKTVAPPKIGRQAVTGEAKDRFAFRTPSLRNVEMTAPYGQAGAYRSLENYLRHHLNPVPTMQGWFMAHNLPATSAVPHELARTNALEPVKLEDNEREDLIAFLAALTDSASLNGRLGKPDNVPSNLEMD